MLEAFRMRVSGIVRKSPDRARGALVVAVTAVLAAALAPTAGASELVARDGTPTIECTPYTSDPRPWRVTFAAAPVDSGDPFLANKTTHRSVYDTARAARRDVRGSGAPGRL